MVQEVLNAMLTLVVLAAIAVGGGALLFKKKPGIFKNPVESVLSDTLGKSEESSATKIITNFFEQKVYLTYWGPHGKQVFEISLKKGEYFLIGRGPECHLILPDLCISGQEAFVGRDDSGYYLGYRGRNGMFDVNHLPLDEVSLIPGEDKELFLGGGPVHIALSFAVPEEKIPAAGSPFARKHPVASKGE